MKPIDQSTAEANGYVAMTMPYLIYCKNPDVKERDQHWLNTVLWDMRNANIVLVEVLGGVEVWRKRNELKKMPKE